MFEVEHILFRHAALHPYRNAARRKKALERVDAETVPILGHDADALDQIARAQIFDHGIWNDRGGWTYRGCGLSPKMSPDLT